MKCHFNDALLASIDKFTFIIYPCTEQFIIDSFFHSFKYHMKNAVYVFFHYSYFMFFFLQYDCIFCSLLTRHILTNLHTTIWCCFLNVHFSFQMCLKIRSMYGSIHCIMISLLGCSSLSLHLILPFLLCLSYSHCE